jgi:hypothetical protein
MRVTDQDTGKIYHLDLTDELRSDLDAYHASHCKHEKTEIRQRKNKGGAWHVYQQCLSCGASVGSAVKRTPDLKNPPVWKQGHEEQYIDAREAERKSIIQKHVRKQKGGDEGFRREYAIYLTSQEWHTKRAKVLKRANGICEGCLERKATQVHHLTYGHIYKEFMFQLIAICDGCHDRLHADEADDEKTGSADVRSEWEDHYPCDGCRYGGENSGRRWCGILDQAAADALEPGAACGPERTSFEPLK